MKKKLALIGIVILVLIVAIFSLSNMQRVTVNFLITTVHLPLVILIICALLVGIILTMLISITTTLKNRQYINQLQQQINKLKQGSHPTDSRKEKVR